jgi:hypothetical protein
MEEKVIQDSTIPSGEDIQKLVTIANAHIVGEKEALQQALDGEVGVPSMIQHTNKYVRASLERAEVTSQITQIDTDIAAVEGHDRQADQEVAVLLHEQSQLREQLHALPQQNGLTERGKSQRRKLTFVEKLLVRLLFATTAPINEAREILRNIALKSDSTASVLTGKTSSIKHFSKSIQNLRASPSVLAEQIASNQDRASLARSNKIAVWYNKRNGSERHRSKS